MVNNANEEFPITECTYLYRIKYTILTITMASKLNSSRTPNSRMALLTPILSDKCLRNHSAVYHLTHPIEECVCEKKVCEVDFAKVLRPIKHAGNIGTNVRNTISDIRKRHNNKNAVGAFRMRESGTEKIQELQLLGMKSSLLMEKDCLEQEISYYKSMSLSSISGRHHESTDSHSDIKITSPSRAEPLDKSTLN